MEPLDARSLLPGDDVSDDEISEVMAAIQRVDPIYSANIASAGCDRGVGSAMNPQQMQNQPRQPRQQQTSSPYVRIVEQPASRALRFRYKCEGRLAGSIPGVNSSPENKTYPTIEIAGYVGRAVVVVSCVTKDPPYRPHPHNLVGKEGCKDGICTVEINSETMRAVFSNLGIQCVRRKDIESALRARKKIVLDPFKTESSHRFQPDSIDLNSVRLCFQVFLKSDVKERPDLPLTPVVSDPIYDKKALSDLVLCRLSKSWGTVAGDEEIILLCEKVAKEDITVRFFEEKDGQVVWEDYGDFHYSDVHKQTAISFRTPRYRSLDIEHPVKVYIQLKRPSDGALSKALAFNYLPLDSGQHMGFLNIAQGIAIQAEPRDISPLLYGMFPNTMKYRMPENSPSPQPLSPPAPHFNLSNTPSHYNMAAVGGNLLSPNNQQQYGGASTAGGLSPNINVDMNDMSGASFHRLYQSQALTGMENYPWNLPPGPSNNSINQLLPTHSTIAGNDQQHQWNLRMGINQEQMTNAGGTRHQQQMHHQDHQQHITNTMNISNAPNIISLMDMDSEELMQLNSAEEK